MAEVDKEDLQVLREMILDNMDRGFSGLNQRLDALNGRTRLVETRVAVLEDRGDQARDPAARRAAVGSLLAGAAIAFWQWFIGK